MAKTASLVEEIKLAKAALAANRSASRALRVANQLLRDSLAKNQVKTLGAKVGGEHTTDHPRR